LPTEAYKKIRKFVIHCDDQASGVCGFSFFNDKSQLIWECGDGYARETVRISENEVIVGVKAIEREGNFFNF
jgi:hypothetical protein